MGCSSCAVDSKGVPRGCGDKGHCSSGSCNKLNTYDWISTRDLYDPTGYHIVEVSFKKGAHKDFFINDPMTRTETGDMVVVETGSGYDIGRITLSGELVRLQMKKKYMSEDRVAYRIIRKANERDLEKLDEARVLEKETMVKARVIARTLGLDLKLGDVEYQGDKKKATFYYTAEGRVDFRELVKDYAREFKIKIEMRQIGARQESARIGGIGSCGRELCCSTWLSDFKSVNTAAARYQNIAINQSKLSGQCGRLKCCLNYELDTYMEALEDFPENADNLRSKAGNASLMKIDIFKGMLYYTYDNDKMRGTIVPLQKSRVKEILELNRKGLFPDELASEKLKETGGTQNPDAEPEHDFEDVTGGIELRHESRNKKKKHPKNKGQERRTDGQSPGAPENRQQRPERSDKNTPSGDNRNRPQRPPSDRPVNQNPPQGPPPPRPPREQAPGSTDAPKTNPEGSNDGTPQKKNFKKKKFFNKNKKPNQGES
jgi:cell fate regulator YaaT (PSP1 superfamily)